MHSHFRWYDSEKIPVSVPLSWEVLLRLISTLAVLIDFLRTCVRLGQVYVAHYAAIKDTDKKRYLLGRDGKNSSRGESSV